MNNYSKVMKALMEKSVLVVLCFSIALASLTVTAKAETTDNNGNYSSSFSGFETVKIFGNDKITEVNDDNIEYEIEEKRECILLGKIGEN